MIPLLAGRKDFVFAAVISAGLHFGLVAVRHEPRSPEVPTAGPIEKIIQIIQQPDPTEVVETQVSSDRPRNEYSSMPITEDIARPDQSNPFTMPAEPVAVYRPDLTNHTPISVGDPGPLVIGPAVFEPRLLDKIPVAKIRIAPRYPFEERRMGHSGEAVVDFIVDPEGKVYGAHAVSSTSDSFAAAAVEALSHWRFVPGMKNGRPVSTHMQLPIVFTLNEGDR